MADLSKLPRSAPFSAGILLGSLLLSGCGLFGGAKPRLGEPVPQKPVVGFAVSPVPEAALAAKHVLNEGGNAADAAVAEGFALAVTLPSRAGLGGGGECLISLPKDDGGNNIPVALLFPPAAAPAGAAAGADRPAAVPEMPRGLLALQARYGRLPLAADMAPAEAMAGGGVPVSRALAADLGVVGNALIADPAARAVFADNAGTMLRAGETMRQPDLATTLSELQSSGVLGFYQGHLSTRFLEAADTAGAGLTAAGLRGTAARYADAVTIRRFGADISVLPGAGGLGAAAAIESLATAPDENLAAQRALAAATAARHGQLGTLPASAGFATLDDKGGAVGCAVTMNNLFGTGRIAPGTGILLAASPAQVTPPLLAVALARKGGAFRAIATGSGQQAAPMAAGAALAGALDSASPMPRPVPAPGRANVIACPRLMPGGAKSCAAAVDPRGGGLAIGSR